MRAFATALESSLQPDERPTVDVAWIRNAADWLDPLVDKRWPDVDIDEPNEAGPDDDNDESGETGKALA